MAKIAIVDYGMGNYHSVERALRHAAPEADIRLCSEAADIDAADRVVFPGQGAMPDCMRTLVAAGLHEAVLRASRAKPLLGVCVGEQMLFERSQEGNTPSLAVFPGTVERFRGPAFERHAGHETLKIPHMGWNQVYFSSHPLWDKIQQNSRFYFVHSYYAIPNDATLITATTEYPTAFACALAKENVFAVQFHPEKSQAVGLQLLNNFLHWDGHV